VPHDKENEPQKRKISEKNHEKGRKALRILGKEGKL